MTISINIPNLQPNVIATFNGQPIEMNSSWYGMMSQLITQLQTNFNKFGYLLPQLDSTTIASLNLTKNVGVIFYDSTTDQIKVNIGGTLKTVTVS